MNQIEKAHELESCIREAGFIEGTEEYEICSRAIRLLGMRYEQTEELALSTIDCSTLTSQSHWEGALIGIPFIADSQRKAESGLSIDGIENAKPADVLVRYRSIDDAPDRKFNHVGLYLGKDLAGQPWLIESRGGQGVILTRAEEFPVEGGIKRFILREMQAFSSADAKNAQRLAKQVPKMGRLGARQYSRTSTARHFHRGQDIYVELGTRVFAPTTGIMRVYTCSVESAKGVEIESLDVPGLVVRMLNVCTPIPTETIVQAGALVGEVDSAHGSEIQYVEGLSTANCHLHLEVECASPTVAGVTGISLKPADSFLFNALYLIKMGALLSPVVLV